MTTAGTSPAARSLRERRQRRRAQATAFVSLDSRACEACWECLAICPNDVLGKIAIGRLHRHARIVAPDACTGCRTCVRACKAGALTPVEAEPLPRERAGR